VNFFSQGWIYQRGLWKSLRCLIWLVIPQRDPVLSEGEGDPGEPRSAACSEQAKRVTAATQRLITSMRVKEILKFKQSFLHQLKAETEADRSGWQRFGLIEIERPPQSPEKP
jgi:hypothetical protein